MSEPHGAAVIGLGVGREHARAYVARPDCRLRWLYDLDGERARAVAREIGQGAAAASLAQVLDDRATHVVSIASYDDAHAAEVLAAFESGKHVFVEKPMCRTADELRAVRRAWAAGGRHLHVNLVLRAAPLYRRLRAMIAAGALGDVYAFDGDYLYGRLHKITDGWRADVADYSVMAGGGVHLIDLMLWLTGQRPATVSAVGNRIATAGSRFAHDDFAAATYEFPGGLVGRITANFGSVHRHQHVVRVFGTRGTFIHDDAGARLHTDRDPSVAPMRIPDDPHPPTKGALIGGFLDAIGRGEDPRPAAEHEFAVAAACIAADQARVIAKPIEVDYD
jgi:predicted dehydrogenase